MQRCRWWHARLRDHARPARIAVIRSNGRRSAREFGVKRLDSDVIVRYLDSSGLHSLLSRECEVVQFLRDHIMGDERYGAEGVP